MTRIEPTELAELPEVQIRSCRIDDHADGKARITYWVSGDPRVIMLYKGVIKRLEGYAKYQDYESVTGELIIDIRCPLEGTLVEAAIEFTRLAVQATISKIELLADQQVGRAGTVADKPLMYRNPRHRQPQARR